MGTENKEAWLGYLALATVIFAVCATLSTFKWSSFSTLSVMSQSQASDQWAHFQSKGIKAYLYQMQAEKMEIELMDLPLLSSRDTVRIYKSRVEDYKNRVERYESEKAEIGVKAKQLEQVRDEAQLHANAFGRALIYLQIAILLSSIAGLLKKKIIWYGGMGTGVIGLVCFVDGYVLFL